MKKVFNTQKATILCVLLAGVLFFSFLKSDRRSFQLAKNIEVFNAIVKELDMFYVDTLDPNKTVQAGIDAMLMSLDPYTNYFPEENQSELEQMLRGSYGGIGSLISYNRKLKHTVIAEPYEGMPAQLIGLKAGDVILEIDGKDMTGQTTTVVSENLRGEVNTSFNLKVERPGVEKPIDFTIVRKSIQLPTVPYYGSMEGNVGYINLNSFSGNPSKEFKEAFLDLKKNKQIQSLVIDLRGNGGGLLDEAIEIVNFFVPRGKTIVTTKGKLKQASNTYKTRREPIDTEIPIAILVDGGTASSSEILAGALQDLDRAVIVGTRTFGKGLVQVPRALPYGGTLKVTTSKYYIPSGRCVQAIDYAQRDEEGNLSRIPDSLTTVFHTEAGRLVRDGGGITPDITVNKTKFPNILYYLLNDNLIFDYATKYAMNHPTIAPAESFELTEANYNDFKTLVKNSDFKYDQQSEKLFKALKEAAEFEGYLTDGQEEFAALEKKLSHNLDKDLDYFAKDIKMLLCNEIVKRYYYQRGAIIQQLKDDNDLKEALNILNALEEYKKVLSVAKN
ncbi:S41 family peptidase [Bacteroides sp. 214]|uniref:S41 family peptidase n=1 Tax=Bacteroides sp. 214 TaxID=2302935 RepID=UPI0013D78825|nr:S41 family peptidase [Bacteroides sp. 214]NDW13298.1 S41 family peptidase [Bacteroides sp. 214]